MADKYTMRTAKEIAFIRAHPHKSMKWIAGQLNLTWIQVKMARNKYGGSTPKPHFSDMESEFRKVYAEGLSDGLMALRLGISRETARRWRTLCNLPKNGWCEMTRRHQGERLTKRISYRRRKDEAGKERANAIAHGLSVHTSEESEFMTAILRFRERNGRPPTFVEGMRVAMSLGWKKGE